MSSDVGSDPDPNSELLGLNNLFPCTGLVSTFVMAESVLDSVKLWQRDSCTSQF